MPDFVHLQTFVRTCELESLAAAARHLGVSAAAVSKQLTKLEQELGVQLLVRSTRHLELTEVGISYYQQCRRIFEEIEIATALISQVKAVPSGILKVVCGRHFGKTSIIPHLKEFLELFPHIELNLELAERMPDLHLESIDLLMGMSISAKGAVIQKKIATTSYVFCASPQYLEKYGTPREPIDLKKHRYITHSQRLPDDELEFTGHVPIKIKPYLRVNDVQSMLDLALDGLGIVKLHDYVVAKDLAKGKLLKLLSTYSNQAMPIYAAYPERRFLPAKVRSFMDFMMRKISKAHL